MSCFFFNDTATTEIYPLSLHDALPISPGLGAPLLGRARGASRRPTRPYRTPLPGGRVDRALKRVVGGLRGRLLAGFVLVAVLPLLLLSLVVTGLISRSVEEAAFGRLGRGLEAVRARLAERRRWADGQAAAGGGPGLPSPRSPAGADRTLAAATAPRPALPDLAIADGRGLAATSRPWP